MIANASSLLVVLFSHFYDHAAFSKLPRGLFVLEASQIDVAPSRRNLPAYQTLLQGCSCDIVSLLVLILAWSSNHGLVCVQGRFHP